MTNTKEQFGFPEEVVLNSSGRAITAEDIGIDSLHAVAGILRSRKDGPTTAKDLMDSVTSRPDTMSESSVPTTAGDHPVIDLTPEKYRIIKKPT